MLLELRPRELEICRCLGPDWSAVMKGRLMSVFIVELESSHLRLLRRLLEALQRHGVRREVDPLVLAELLDDASR